MKHIKIFPKSRLCIIDVFPVFVEALNTALKFAETHNITINTKDGKNIILGFCLKRIQQIYKDTVSPYPKVLCLSVNTNNLSIKHFAEKHIDKLVTKLTLPYCGKHSLNSPDIEYAAEVCLDKIKKKETFVKYAKKLNLRGV